MSSNFTYFTFHHNLIEYGQIVSTFCRLTRKVFNEFSFECSLNIYLVRVLQKPVRFFLKVSPSVGSGFLSSPGFLRARVRSAFVVYRFVYINREAKSILAAYTHTTVLRK